jgi:hypothetical protein
LSKRFSYRQDDRKIMLPEEKLDKINLIFMDPCIVVWLNRNNQRDATLY